MKVLLTGAAGRLGSQAWTALLAAGHEVRATDSRYRRDTPGPLEVLDLVEERPCYRLIEGCDAIAHLGNIPGQSRAYSGQAIYQTNCAININVFQAAHEIGVDNIVFASSIQACGGYRQPNPDEGPTIDIPYLPLDSDVPARPCNTYALSKQAGEEMLRHYAFINEAGCYVAFRFPALLTRKWRESMFAAPRSDRLRGSRHHGPTVNEAMAFLTMEDAASLVCQALERPKPGYRQYLPSSRLMRPGWTVAAAIEELYADVPLRQPVEQMTGLVDVSDLMRDFDWEPAHTDACVREAEQRQREDTAPA